MNIFNKNFQELHEISYKGKNIQIQLLFNVSSLILAIIDANQMNRFEIELSKNNIPFKQNSLMFLVFIIKQSIQNHLKNKELSNDEGLAEKTVLKLYKLSEVQLFDIFPKYTKNEFEKIKLQNNEKTASNLLEGKGILFRIKIGNFKQGFDFDFRLQIPKIFNRVKNAP